MKPGTLLCQTHESGRRNLRTGPINPHDILDFWFVEIEPKLWFQKDDAFDKTISDRFGVIVETALSGGLTDWMETDAGRLALVILLDQFARNIFRSTPKSFAGDTRSLSISIQSLAEGFLLRNEQNERYFMLMPMMHSEDLAIQNASLPLFEKFATENAHEYAIKHRDIIDRFGRFPHRNDILGRQSTPQEVEFLTRPGSSF